MFHYLLTDILLSLLVNSTNIEFQNSFIYIYFKIFFLICFEELLMLLTLLHILSTPCL